MSWWVGLILALLDFAIPDERVNVLEPEFRRRHRTRQVVIVASGLLVSVGGAIVISRLIESIGTGLAVAGAYLVITMLVMIVILRLESRHTARENDA